MALEINNWRLSRANHNPQFEQDVLDKQLESSRTLIVDVTTNLNSALKTKHLRVLLDLLSTVYPEVAKMAGLANKLLQDMNSLVREIKVPVVTSLGIKAVVLIEDIDYQRLS